MFSRSRTVDQGEDIGAPRGPAAAMTERQSALLAKLCDRSGEPFDPWLSHRQAARRIVELQKAHDAR